MTDPYAWIKNLTDEQLKQRAREAYAWADLDRSMLPYLEEHEPEKVKDCKDSIRFNEALGKRLYAAMSKPPPSKPEQRILILSDGTVVGQGEASSLKQA